MNKPIRVVSVFCLVLFMALLVNVTYLMYVRADSLSDDPRNRRIITATFSRERGAILVGILAGSVVGESSMGFIGGLAVGLALMIAIWLIDQRRKS